MKALIAEFTSVEAIAEGARLAREQGFPLRDALTPYPLPVLTQLVGASPPDVRVPMALAGFGVAIFAFGLQWWSAVYGYRFNSGGRPLFSWPVFLLVPFEVGVLVAGLAGFVAFLVRCGLPRLNHPVFDVPGIERVTQDRFFLIVDPLEADRIAGLRVLLFGAGARTVIEDDA